MKQGNAAGSMMDLDDLERQLNAAVGSRKSVGDDPLAELARIVGRDDALAASKAASKLSAKDAGTTAVQRIAPSFDDFLKVPPRPASGAMPNHTPAIEPLFPEILPQKSQDAIRDPFGDLADLEELQLRPVTDEAHQDEALPQASLAEDHSLIDDESLQETEVESEIFADEAHFRDLETLPEHMAKAAADIPALADSPPNDVKKDKFDDMLAEFEAAMKDVGAEKSTPESVPSLAPIVIPPPPADLAYSQLAPSSMPSAYGMGAVAAGTMVAGSLVAGSLVSGSVAAGTAAQEQTYNTAVADDDKRSKKRRGLMLAGGVLGVALIGIASLVTSGNVSKQAVGTNAPMIAAKPGVIKERPVNPGGVEVPNQDKEVLQTKVADPKAPERVAPREEQPVDLTQAQRLAQSQQLVRQIPGIAIVAPISTTPPPTAPAVAPVPGASPSVAGSQPVPRPVASVPISITGQPIAPVVPVATPPVPIAATPTAPSVSPPAANAPATPTTTAPVKAPAVASQLPAASAEPRRVRAVPIRSETAEAAPSRSQSQPRIVQANPNRLTAEEPDAANAPLRITPQSNRATTRVATAQPATTQTTSSQAVAPASGGSGFAVQLAAEGSEDAARSKFNRVKSQHSDVLGSYSPNIRSAEVNGKSVYRVRVGSLSREEAVGLCERLKASGGNCFVARN